MHGGTLPLLEDHRIFHSRNVEEAYAFMRHKGFGLDIHPRRVGDFDMRLDGVYLPGMWFGYFQYGAPVVTQSVARDDYWVQLPVRGQIEAAGSSSSVECDMRRAAVLSPTRTDFYLVRSSDTCVRLCLSLYKASLVRQLTALLGEPPRRPLEFAPELDVTSGYGRGLIRHVLTMIAEVESGSLLANPVVLSSFEQFILTGVLMSHPHTYSEALRQLERPIAPRDVRRAVDFIEAHLNSSFTVAELVQATGVAGRTLFKHFKDFKGVSPMRYARNARFQQVRQALLRAEAEQGVTDIAASCGFAHLGRFAVEYRRRFGESPSHTLRRQRNSR